MTANATEFAAILEHAAVAILHNTAALRATGPDATRWLNGMVTNSVQALAPGEGAYCFLLNAQGRIQGDCTVYREPSEASQTAAFWIVTTREQIETIHTLLDKFIIMDDVELTRIDSFSETLLVLGPKAADVLRRLNLPEAGSMERFASLAPLRMAFACATDQAVLTPFIPTQGVPRFELALPSEHIAALFEQAKQAGAVEVSPETLEALRIFEARPKFGIDIRDRDLPQETNQQQALHFNKGCYLGQEIVERIRSRGQVHRLLTQFELLPAPNLASFAAGGGPAFPREFPAALTTGEPDAPKQVGELTSAALVPLPDGPKLLALGYARREALDLKQDLRYDGGRALPRD